MQNLHRARVVFVRGTPFTQLPGEMHLLIIPNSEHIIPRSGAPQNHFQQLFNLFSLFNSFIQAIPDSVRTGW